MAAIRVQAVTAVIRNSYVTPEASLRRQRPGKPFPSRNKRSLLAGRKNEPDVASTFMIEQFSGKDNDAIY
jgi:hypothetical protein